MNATITIKDETTTGQTTGEFSLDVLTETITVSELIRSRVYQEVKDFNAKRPEYFRGLVQPEEAEATREGYRLPDSYGREGRQLDWRKQYEAAIDAFQKNRFLVLVGERQVDELDQEITVGAQTEVTFLRMVPLVGG